MRDEDSLLMVPCLSPSNRYVLGLPECFRTNEATTVGISALPLKVKSGKPTANRETFLLKRGRSYAYKTPRSPPVCISLNPEPMMLPIIHVYLPSQAPHTPPHTPPTHPPHTPTPQCPNPLSPTLQSYPLHSQDLLGSFRN